MSIRDVGFRSVYIGFVLGSLQCIIEPACSEQQPFSFGRGAAAPTARVNKCDYPDLPRCFYSGILLKLNQVPGGRFVPYRILEDLGKMRVMLVRLRFGGIYRE